MKFAFPAYETPPDKYRATFPDGTVIVQNHREDWYSKIKAHFVMNGYPLPDDWKEQFEHQLCQLLPPGFCKWETGEDARPLLEARLTMGDLFRGMEVLLRIAASPDPLVDQKEADRRAAICGGCFANLHIPGCAPCMKIPDMVASIAGARTTKYDYLLKSCGVCHCQNSAAVWIKESILAKGITHDMHAKYQQLPWCWRRDIQPEA